MSQSLDLEGYWGRVVVVGLPFSAHTQLPCVTVLWQSVAEAHGSSPQLPWNFPPFFVQCSVPVTGAHWE